MRQDLFHWKTFAKEAGAFIIAALGLVSAFLYFEEEKLLWLFGGVVIAGVFFSGWPRIHNLWRKAKRYDDLRLELTTKEAAIAELRSRVEALRAQRDELLDTGVREGRAQVLGASLAQQLSEMPTMLEIVEGDDGIVIVCDYKDGSEPKIGARFELQLQHTGVSRGVIEVISVEAETRQATCVCVEQSSSAFWRQLEDRAAADPQPPAGIKN